MKRLFLIAGHHDKDPGAIAQHPILGEIREADLTKELRDLLEISLRNFNPNMVIIKDQDNWTLQQVINYLKNEMTDEDILIDIHLNSFPDSRANGCETLVRNNADQSTISFAKDLNDDMVEVLEVRDRGVKTEMQSGRTRIGILHGKGIRVLIEPIFLSNENDVNQYGKNKHLLVDKLTKRIENQML
jgi:N-acetylmuramoyl-L-alanine amidase